MQEADLSKIIGIIMENPKLIEEIKGLASSESKKENVSTDEGGIEEAPTEKSAAILNTESRTDPSRARRRDLLMALKPYVSQERGHAIDSMMSIADILDVMRTK